MLRKVQINSSTANDEGLRKLYETSFPRGEIIPYEEFIKALDKMNIDYTAYYDGDMLVGMTATVNLPKYNYGAYFAVREELRGKGYGKKIFRDLLDKYSTGNIFLGEIESPLQADAPNLEIRKKRLAFYLQLGMKETGISYTDSTGTYTVVSYGKGTITKEEFDEINVILKPYLDMTELNNKAV